MIVSLLLRLLAKEFLKSVNIWQSYGQEYIYPVFAHWVLPYSALSFVQAMTL